MLKVLHTDGIPTIACRTEPLDNERRKLLRLKVLAPKLYEQRREERAKLGKDGIYRIGGQIV